MFPEIENLHLSIPYYNGFFHIFKICEKKTGKKNCQFVTPPIIISNINNKYNVIRFCADDIRLEKTYLLTRYLYTLEKRISKKISQILDTNISINSCVETWNNANFIKTNIYSQDINIYDQNRNLLTYKDLRKRSLVKCLIWIKEIRVQEGKLMMILEVLQIKLMDPLPPKLCVIDMDDEMVKNKKNEKYPPKYQKMLNMGVPIQAVENKMRMDGKTSLILNSNKPILKFNFNSIKLKKTIICPRPVIPKKKTNQMIPSLDDIKTQLKNLKKTTTLKCES